MIRALSPLFRPLFESNHTWCMRRGEQNLRLEMARRQATTAEQRAAIREPPSPGLLAGSSGTVIVRDGVFAFVLSRKTSRASTIDITMMLRADATQPPATQDLLGPRGEHMAADIGGADYSDWLVTERIRV